MQRRWTGVLVCVVVCGLSAACSGAPTTRAGEGAASTPPDAAVSTTPTPGPGEPSDAAPVMPALAREHSTAGARAFVRYYIAVLNDATANGTGRLLGRVSTKDCFVCTSIARHIESMARAGGQQVGAAWHVRRMDLLPTDGPSHTNLSARLHIDAGTSQLSRAARVERLRAQTVVDSFFLVWLDGRWLLRNLVPL